MPIIQDIIDPVYEAVMTSLTGMIWMFSGLLEAIPDGWAICDGNNGTPDLRSRFLYGAAIDGDVEDTGDTSEHQHVFNDPGHWHATAQHDHTVDAHLHQVNTHQHYHNHPEKESSSSTNCDNDGTGGFGGPNCYHTHRWNMAFIYSSFDAPFTDERSPDTDEADPNTEIDFADGNAENKTILPPWMKLFFIMKL